MPYMPLITKIMQCSFSLVSLKRWSCHDNCLISVHGRERNTANSFHLVFSLIFIGPRSWQWEWDWQQYQEQSAEMYNTQVEIFVDINITVFFSAQHNCDRQWQWKQQTRVLVIIVTSVEPWKTRSRRQRRSCTSFRSIEYWRKVVWNRTSSNLFRYSETKPSWLTKHPKSYPTNPAHPLNGLLDLPQASSHAQLRPLHGQGAVPVLVTPTLNATMLKLWLKPNAPTQTPLSSNSS